MSDQHRAPYLNTAGFAARIGLAMQPLTKRIERGVVPKPDVIIGDNFTAGGTRGWSSKRVDMYAEYERLLRKLYPKSGRSLDVFTMQPFPSWWDVQTEWYLSQQEVADILGYQPISITMGRIRKTFTVEPVVRIGTRKAGIKCGWDQEAVMIFGQQNRGQVTERGKVIDIARSGPPRRAVDPAYWDRVTAQRRAAKLAKTRATENLPLAA